MIKEDKDRISIIISIIISILMIIGFITLYYLLSINTRNYRDSNEGRCLSQIAKEYCESINMEFYKIYSPLYTSDFACNQRGHIFEYDFLDSELIKCSGESR